MKLSKKNSLSPSIWGSTFWDTLHFAAFGYPNDPNDNDKDAYKSFIKQFVKILPCDKCSIDARLYVDNMSELNWVEVLENRDSLLKWSWNFHDKINIKLNKISIPLNEFLDEFVSKRSPNVLSWYTAFYRFIVFIIFIIVCLFYARYLRTTR